MTERHSILEDFGHGIAPVHRDGHKFVAIAAGATLLLFWLWPPLGWLAAIGTVFVAYFFRDPDRVVPLRAGLLLSPADGTIAAIDTVPPPAELGLGTEPRQRVAIRLTLFDVHIVRAPIAGRLARAGHSPGAFVGTTLDKASDDNERRFCVVAGEMGPEVGVVMIAGVVSRRIVPLAEEGTMLGAGQRIGLIRFGSRVELYLPPGGHTLAAVGQRTVAGETVLADVMSSEPEREARVV